MRSLDANSAAALVGSRQGDTLTVWAWYGGSLAIPTALPVTDWGLSYDTTRQIQTIDLTIADTDGTLAPWLLDDPLGVGGSRLQVFYNIGAPLSGGQQTTLAYDWFRIVENDPEESWLSYVVTNQGAVNVDSPLGNGVSQKWASGGATIKLKGETLTRNIAINQFLAPSSPASGSPTVVSEIKRILADIMPVTTVSGVVDAAVPSNVIYQGDRLNAVQALAQRIGCDIRTNGSGMLEIYPIANTGTVWTLAPGAENFQISVKRTMKLDGLYNVFVADGTGSGQNPIRGIARITGGPLKDGGNHGSYQTFYSSNMIATQAQADAYAATMRDTQLRGITVPLVATCLPDPRLQQGDWISVNCPTTTALGSTTFPARVRTIDLKGHDGIVDAMTLGLDASYADVAARFAGVSRNG